MRKVPQLALVEGTAKIKKTKSISFQNFVKEIAKYNKIITIIGLISVVAFIIYGWQLGIFTSTEKMEIFLSRYGVFAPIIFIFIQIIQVVIPVLPGGLGCVFGVMFFGAGLGFAYNYIGLCIGSILAFVLGRKYGKKFVVNITGQKFFDKYSKYLDSKHGFNKILAICIFLPVAPDDFLCYLAGISEISFKKFITIILLGKPAAIFLYSMGLDTIINFLIK